jgi:hypothetical protein
MIIFVLLAWIVTIGFLYPFFNSSSELQELLFLGSLGAPLTLPLLTIGLTILYFWKG